MRSVAPEWSPNRPPSLASESTSSEVPNPGRTERRKVGHIPASAQCLDQQDACVYWAPLDINGGPLVGNLDCLRGDDLEVSVDAAFVTLSKKLQRLLR